MPILLRMKSDPESKKDPVTAYWRELCYLKNLFNGKVETNNVLQLPIHADACHIYVNDFIIRLLTELIDWLKIKVIDIRGCDEITDLGIKWLSEVLPKCSNLTTIHLDGCSQLTEVSLQYILHGLPHGVELHMRGTNVNYISPNFDKFLTETDFTGCLAIPYSSIREKSMKSGLLIWQELSIKESCLQALIHNKLVPIRRHGVNYEREWIVKNADHPEAVNLTVLELNSTESPIHSLLPHGLNQILLVVNDDETMARRHIVRSIVYFLTRHELQSGICEFWIKAKELPVQRKKDKSSFSAGPSIFADMLGMESIPDPPQINHSPARRLPLVAQKKMPSKRSMPKPPPMKMSKKFTEDVPEEYEDAVPDQSYESDESQTYYNMVVSDGWIIPHYLTVASFWKSKTPFNGVHDVYRVLISPSSVGSANYGIGWCVAEPSSEKIGTFLSSKLQDDILVNIPKRLILMNGTWSDLPHYDIPQKGFVVEFILGRRSYDGLLDESVSMSLSLMIADKCIYSSVIALKSYILHPCVFCTPGAHQNLLFFTLPNRTENVVSDQSKADIKKLGISHLRSGMDFLVVCTGTKAQEMKTKMESFSLKDGLQEYLDKLISLEKKLRKKPTLAQEYHLQVKLAQMSQCIEEIRLFSSEISNRVKYFSLDTIHFKNEEIKECLLRNLYADMSYRPHVYVKCDIMKAIENLNKKNIHKKIVNFQTLARDFSSKKSQNFLTNVLHRRHNLCQCIYLEELQLVIEDIPWFYNLLHTFATRPPLKASGRVNGLSEESAVWKEEELQTELKGWNVDDLTRDIVKKALIHLGALIILPCLRLHTADENYIYSSPFAVRRQNADPLMKFRKVREMEKELAIATRTYHMIAADLYSCFPAFISRVSRIGQLQALSPSGAVFHIGASEVMITANEDSIELAAYCHKPQWPKCLHADLAIHEYRLLTYLWSILHLFTDCMDAVVKENRIMVHVVSNCLNEPVNKSIGYFHKWAKEMSADEAPYSVCTLCQNCSSVKGLTCPYNRIHGNHVSQCLCMDDVAACLECGLCKSCANYLWNIHVTINPNRLLTFSHSSNPIVISEHKEAKLRPLCAEPLQISMNPSLTLRIHQSTRVALCLKRGFNDNVITLLNSDAEIVPLSYLNLVTIDEPKTITLRLSELSRNITSFEQKDTGKSRGLMSHQSNLSPSTALPHEDNELEQWIRSLPFTYTECTNMNLIPHLGVLTYDVEELPHASPGVAIFIGPEPMPENRDVRFEMEVLNRGIRGTITIGLVPRNYSSDSQPGWRENSIGYHGDDGKIFHNELVGVRLKTFDRKHEKIGVSLLPARDDKRIVRFYLNNQQVYEGELAGTVPVYPAIGMHSLHEQVQLIDSSYWNQLENASQRWKDKENVDQLDCHVLPDTQITVMPKNTLRFLPATKTGRATQSVAHLHFIRSENVPFRVQMQSLEEKVPLEIRYVGDNNDKKVGAESRNGIEIKLEGEKELHSFMIKSPFRGNTFDTTQPVLRVVITPNLQIPEIREEVLYFYSVQRLPNAIQTDKLFALPYRSDEPYSEPSHLMEVDVDGVCKKYRIPSGNYKPYLLYQDIRTMTVSFKNYPPVQYTHNFCPGNLVCYDESSKTYLSQTRMIEKIDWQNQNLSLSKLSNKVPFNSKFFFPFITNLYLAENATKFPLSYPSPLILEGNEDSHSTSQLLYIPRGGSCDPRLGQSLLDVEALVMGGNRNPSNSSFLDLSHPLAVTNSFSAPHLFLPRLNEKEEKLTRSNDDSETIVHHHTLLCHSILELTNVNQLRIHAYCESATPSNVFEEFIHIQDHAGIDGASSHLTDEKVFFNRVATRAYLILLRQKLIVCSHKQLIELNHCDLTKQEIEFYLHQVLHKYASYCTMIGYSPFISKQQELSSTFTIPAQKFSEEFSRSSDMFTCETHSLEYFDLDAMMKNDMDGTQLEHSPLFKYSQCLANLSIRSDKLKQLPENFFLLFRNIKQLVILNMPLLETLPRSLEDLRYLQNLTINAESLKELPSNLTCLTNLRMVLIESSNVKQLTGQLSHNNRLRSLLINSTPLQQFSKLWCSCDSLTELVLGDVTLSDLPPEFANLRNLSLLMMTGPYYTEDIFYRVYSGESISPVSAIQMAQDGAPTAQSKTNLFTRVLDASAMKKLNELNDTKQLAPYLFFHLPRLGLGHPLSKSQVASKKEKSSTGADNQPKDYGGLPPCLFQLKKLVALRLNMHAIRWISDDAASWEQLDTLDLSSNPFLETVSATIGTMKNLKNLNLSGCPSLNTPPEEIVNRGSAACIAYLKSLSSKQVTCRRTKLMFVGLGGAGKTSLLRALMSETNKTDETSSENITDGIDITQWEVPMEDGNTLTYSMWDFAGQSVYYNTHQFFLSKRAIYLLLWSVRLGYEHAGLDFWLSSIMCHAPNAPILIVGTHADQVAKITLPSEMLQKRYPQIVGFYTVSSITGYGISDLKKSLIDNTLSQSYMGEKIPQILLDFESRLINQRRAKKDILPWKNVKTISMECGIHEEKEVRNAVRFLHDLGSLQFFDTDFLRDIVVINPQWIVNVMSCVVSVKNSPIENGIFYHKDIPIVWQNFNSELHSWLLQLTEEFDLTFPLPGTASTDENYSPANIVPCLLPEREPQIDWPKPDPSKDLRQIKVIYRFSYLPAGLFNRIQVRLFEFSDGKKIWKMGSLLRKNEQYALVKQEERNTLAVLVHGYRPENFFFMVDEVIDSIVRQSFQGIQYELLVPCPECVLSQNIKNESLFESSLVRRAIDKNVPFLQCHIDFHVTSIQTILGLLPPTSGEDHDLHLQNSLANLLQMRMANAYGILYSYVKEDFDECTHVKLEQIVERLSKLGVTCGDLTKMNSLERQQHMLDVGLYVMLISHRYAENAELISLYRYVHEKLNKPICLVCVGKSKDWMQSTIAMFVKDEVYLDLTAKKASHIKDQLNLLEERARAKLLLGGQDQRIFDCFLSYCHKNSHDAVSKGVKAGAKSLGWSGGDPRAIYTFLMENGISCWIDTVYVGATPLYDAIHRGLSRSKIFICFFSNDYPESKNCDLEFSFATSNLQRPIIYVHVGGEMVNSLGNTKLHMLKHKFPGPELSMVDETLHVYDKFLQIVKEELSNAPEPKVVEDQSSNSKKTSMTAYKEETELAQRNFLKQLQNFSLAMNMKPYPRLLLVDFLVDPSTVIPSTEPTETDEMPSRTSYYSQNVSIQQSMSQSMVSSLITSKRGYVSNFSPSVNKPVAPQMKQNFTQLQQNVKEWSAQAMCLRVLCENERGWHLHGEPLKLPLNNFLIISLVVEGASYLGPLYQLARSSGIDLNCFRGEVGETFLSFVEEKEKTSANNRFDAYISLHNTFLEYDEELSRGALSRCKLGSGKIVWLCSEHQKEGSGRVHLLPVDDTSDANVISELAVQEGERALRELLIKEAENEHRLYGAAYAASMKLHLSYLESKKQNGNSTKQDDKTEASAKRPLRRRQTSSLLLQEEVTAHQETNSRPWRPKTDRGRMSNGMIREDSSTSLDSRTTGTGSKACHIL